MLTFILTGCNEDVVVDDVEANSGQPTTSIINRIQIDDKRLYERDQDDSIKTLYVTVLPNEKILSSIGMD